MVWPVCNEKHPGAVQNVLEVVNRIVRGPLVLGALGPVCVCGWRSDKGGHGLWNHVAAAGNQCKIISQTFTVLTPDLILLPMLQ